jgi:hypothetical protein
LRVILGWAFVLACLLVACSPAGSQPTEESHGTAAENLAPHLVNRSTCPASSFVTDDLEDLLAGSVAIRGFDPVTFGDEIDWAADPYEHVSWRFRFHSLGWVRPYLDQEDAYDRVRDVLLQWHENNPVDAPPSDFSWSDHSTARRAEVYACAARIFGSEGWLREALERHGQMLADDDFYVDAGNHALDQDIGLHKVACVLGNDDWQNLAEQRMSELAYDSIDEEGVTNEGAIYYQLYNWRRYGVAIDQVEACGRPVPGALHRRNRMPVLLAHGTRPDGRYEVIGDTWPVSSQPIAGTIAEYAATQGESGPLPDRRVAVFDAGYIFGRSGWGEDRSFDEENFYAIRFGPGGIDRFHRHADHTAITWHPRGIPVLIDSGFDGYGATSYRFQYSKAAEGHNVVVDRDGTMEKHRGTRLDQASIRHHVGEESYHLFGAPYQGIHRHRRVLVVHEPPMLVIRDDLVSGRNRTYDQLWHLPPGFTVDLGERGALIEGDGAHISMLQLVAGTDMRVAEGEEDPYQGWVSWGENERTTAPTIIATERAQNATFVTVFADARQLEADLIEDDVSLVVDGQPMTVSLSDPMKVTSR